MIEQFLRFCLVGGSGALIDFCVTYLLKEKAKCHRYLANACGFVTAATNNYLLNRIWTFESTNPAIGYEYGLFFLFAVIGLLINTAVLYLFAERISIPLINPNGKLRFYVAKGVAIGVVTIWNFFMNYFITFGRFS